MCVGSVELSFEGPHRQQLEASFRELVRSGTKPKAERLAIPLALTLRNIWLACVVQAKHKTHGPEGCFDDRASRLGRAECAARSAGGDVGSSIDHVAHAPMLVTCDARFVMVIVGWMEVIGRIGSIDARCLSRAAVLHVRALPDQWTQRSPDSTSPGFGTAGL